MFVHLLNQQTTKYYLERILVTSRRTSGQLSRRNQVVVHGLNCLRPPTLRLTIKMVVERLSTLITLITSL
jgi:hypothetical protein